MQETSPADGQAIDPARAMRAMGEPGRLRIVRLLLHAGTPLCVCEISGTLSEPEYQISRRLDVLKKAGIVRSKKLGLWVYYGLCDNPALTEALRLLFSSMAVSPLFQTDEENLKKHLTARVGDRCVTSRVPEKDGEETESISLDDIFR